MRSNNAVKQFGVMRSMSSGKARDELMKTVSSAYSTSGGKVASGGGGVGRRDRRSRAAASRQIVRNTGQRLKVACRGGYSRRRDSGQ